MARLRASWRTSLPVVQQPRNPQSESIARTPYQRSSLPGRPALSQLELGAGEWAGGDPAGTDPVGEPAGHGPVAGRGSPWPPAHQCWRSNRLSRLAGAAELRPSHSFTEWTSPERKAAEKPRA